MKGQQPVPAPTRVLAPVPGMLTRPRPASRWEAEPRPLREIDGQQVVAILDDADRLDQPWLAPPDLAPEDHVSEAPAHRPDSNRRLDWRVPMAVPKKKTSKSRRDKRRAQHKIESPRLNICPQCGQPKRPHRVCPTCHTYRGRDIDPLRTPVP